MLAIASRSDVIDRYMLICYAGDQINGNMSTVTLNMRRNTDTRSR